MSNRDRFGLKLTGSLRDRRIATWIDWQRNEGRDVSEMIKNILDEMITGKSCLTGKMMVYQGDVANLRPDPSDPIAEALNSFED